MSDPMGKGYLEKTGFFVALKLIALAQSKQEMTIVRLTVETPPPDLVGVTLILYIHPNFLLRSILLVSFFCSSNIVSALGLISVVRSCIINLV